MCLKDASPAQNSPASHHQRDVAQRDHWATERKSASVSECVHFLKVSLTVVVYERGLVLDEQMAEC